MARIKKQQTTQAMAKILSSPSVVRSVWADGSRHKVDPDAVREEFRRIYEREHELTPQTLVEESRDEDAILHPEFTWDDQEAAEKWRIEEGAHILRSHMTVFEIKTDKGVETTPPMRTLIKLELRGAEEPYGEKAQRWVQTGVYAPIHEVMADEEARRLYVRSAWFDLASWRRKYRDIAEFAEIFEQIDAVGRKLGIAS